MVPETRYAKSGNLHIAYQVTGDGPVDLVFVHGWISHIEHLWEEPSLARFLSRLASFSRLILLDKRGTGLSDPVPLDKLPTLEERMDDLRAVMAAAGSERAALLGTSEAGALNLLFSATHPERTAALILLNSYARLTWAEDYPTAFVRTTPTSCSRRSRVAGERGLRLRPSWLVRPTIKRCGVGGPATSVKPRARVPL